MAFVDLREEGVGRLAEDGSGETGNDAASECDGEVCGRGKVALRLFGHAAVHGLVAELVGRELADRIGNLSAVVRGVGKGDKGLGSLNGRKLTCK